MRRAMGRVSERLLAIAADTDADLGHAIRDQARHFGEAMLRKAKGRGSEVGREPRKPLLNTTGLCQLRSASMSGVDVLRKLRIAIANGGSGQVSGLWL